MDTMKAPYEIYDKISYFNLLVVLEFDLYIFKKKVHTTSGVKSAKFTNLIFNNIDLGPTLM